MPYQTSPYSELDWLTAALMGEAGPRDTATAMGALADVIMNRANGTQAPSTAYGNRFTYDPNTVAGQISAYQGASPQFSSYDERQSRIEGNGSAGANTSLMTALTKGAAGFSGDALRKYNQAREVAATFLDQENPNYGRYTGSSGGSDFFVAKGFPTYLRNGGRYASQTIGGSDFFKLASNGGFTPWNDVGDRGVGSALPRAGSDGFGQGIDVSGEVNDGSLRNPGGLFETAGGFPFTQANVGLGGFGGLGSFGAGITPNQPAPGRYAFGGLNVGDALGLGNGSLATNLLPHQPAPGDYGFSGQNVSQGVGSGDFTPTLGSSDPGSTANLSPLGFSNLNVSRGVGNGTLNPALGSYAGISPLGFSGANVSAGVPNGVFNPALSNPSAIGSFGFSGADVSGNTAPGSMAGFDGARYLAANPDVAAVGMDPLQHYLLAGRQEGRSLGVDTTTTGILPTSYTSLSQGGDTGSTIGAGPSIGSLPSLNQASYLGPGRTASFLGPSGFNGFLPFGGINAGTLGAPDASTIGAGPALQGLSPTQAGTIGAGPTAFQGLNPFLAGGIPSGQAIDSLGVDGTTPTIGPSTASTIGNQGIVQAWSPGQFGARGNPFMPSFAAPTIGPTQSQTIPGFDAAAYLKMNPDVAAAHVDPLQHYLNHGISEGRSFGVDATGHTIVAPGLTPTLGAPGLTSTLGSGSEAATLGAGPSIGTIGAGPSITPLGPDTHTTAWGGGGISPLGFSGLNASRGLGVGLGAFGLGGFMPETGGLGSASSPAVSNFGFSGANVGGGLGATPQTFASLYPISSGGSPLPDTGAGIGSFGFSTADVGGFDTSTPTLGHSGVPTSSTPLSAVAGGTPFGGSSIVGGFEGGVRSDGTTAGTKSLAQTNAEFSAVTPNYFAREGAQDALRNANMASFGNPSLQSGAPATAPMGFTTGAMMTPTIALPSASIGAIPLANGSMMMPLPIQSFAGRF